MLSVEGVDLRQDDHNLATGQLITTSVIGAIGDTTLNVVSIPVALLRGHELTFDNAAMSVPVTVRLTSVAALGATTLSVEALTTVVNAGATARDSGVNTATGARLLVGARKGTSRVKLYCNARYDDSQLALSGTVLDWATICACKFLATRRAQGCPKSILADYEECVEEMRAVQTGQLSIEDIGTRGSDWPSIVNVTVNPSYDGMRARVQPAISEGTPTAYGQFVDWNSARSLWV
jgi:hypothetical protein